MPPFLSLSLSSPALAVDRMDGMVAHGHKIVLMKPAVRYRAIFAPSALWIMGWRAHKPGAARVASFLKEDALFSRGSSAPAAAWRIYAASAGIPCVDCPADEQADCISSHSSQVRRALGNWVAGRGQVRRGAAYSMMEMADLV
jgi:hypothetical protein